MNKFQHDNLSTVEERKCRNLSSIHPRVFMGQAYGKKSNTCKSPNEGTKLRLIAALKGHLGNNPNDIQSQSRLSALTA